MSDATLHIGEVAERVDLSLRSVRYYEEQGLISPEGRTAGGFRLYTQAQIDRLLTIKQMKPLGFSLEQMRSVLEARDTLRSPAAATPAAVATARAELEELTAYAETRIIKLRRAIDAGGDLIAELRADTSAAA
ncbi:MAG: MerR family transcriptional regulator [Solirubrobacteraceae bacterium]|nr:MerR family transcriptional regulator [Solirubrobacteraceae bacterium]